MPQMCGMTLLNVRRLEMNSAIIADNVKDVTETHSWQWVKSLTAGHTEPAHTHSGFIVRYISLFPVN